MNDLTLAGQLVTAPSHAFAELRERPRFLLPLLVLSLASAGLIFWYYAAADFEWLKDHLMSGNARFQSLSESDRARILSSMTRNRLLWSSVIGALIGVPLVVTLQALYFLLAGKITNVQQSFKHWFSLGAWSGLPSLLGVLTGAIVLAMQGANVQMGPESLQVLSLNELIFHRGVNDPGYTLLASLSLLSFWCWALTVIGVHTWSKRSWSFSTIFALLPYAIVYGAMALFALQ